MTTFEFQKRKRYTIVLTDGVFHKRSNMFDQNELSTLDSSKLTEPFKAEFQIEATSFEDADKKYIEFAKEIQAEKKIIAQKFDEEYNAFLVGAKKLVLSGSTIETNRENLEKVLYGLNQINWGSWTLPTMTIGYSAHQYDCDGTTVTTIQLNNPIAVDDKFESKFKTFSPNGHLEKYYRL